MVGDAPSCALLDGFAIGARVALLWQHSANTKCQRVLVLALCLVRLVADSLCICCTSYNKLYDFVECYRLVVQLSISLLVGFLRICCAACCTTNPQLIEQVGVGLNAVNNGEAVDAAAIIAAAHNHFVVATAMATRKPSLEVAPTTLAQRS